jgi:uncharacterized protein (TIGR02145 family)
VNALPTITHDGSSGAASQSVNRNVAITAIVYTASDAAAFSMTGSFPTDVTGIANGSSYTISGTPSISGTFGYSLTASANSCASAAAAGTITVQSLIPTSIGGPATAYSTTTWIIGSQTWSDRLVASPSCALKSHLTSPLSSLAEYKKYGDRVYYSWACAYNQRSVLCPSGWHLPTAAEFAALLGFFGQSVLAEPSVLSSEWGLGGYAYESFMSDTEHSGGLWSATAYETDQRSYALIFASDQDFVTYMPNSHGLQVRCVK